MFAEDSGIRVKKDRHEECAEQISEKQGTGNTVIIIFQAVIHKKRIKEHGEKTQFHVFPCGFADRKEKSQYEVVSRPLVNKMRKSAGYGNEYDAEDGIIF